MTSRSRSGLASRLVASVAVLLGLIAPVVVTAPAQAAASNTVKVTSPAPNSVVPTGHRTYRVKVTGWDEGTYTLKVEGCLAKDPYYEAREFWHDGGRATYTLTLPAARCAGGYSVAVNEGEEWDFGRRMTKHLFTVKAPRVNPTITSFTPNRYSFWPTVREGYQDTVTLRWRTRSASDVAQIEVLNKRGTVVARSGRFRGSNSWDWRGYLLSGGTATPGTYRARLVVTNDTGGRATRTLPIAVKRGWVVADKRVTRDGHQTSARRTRGNCSIYSSSYFGEASLDCWAGNYAEADYVFTIPRDAHNIRWSMAGEVRCCDTGLLQRTGTRISPTRYRVRVKVTNWRAYDVDSVALSYRAKTAR